MKLKHATFFAVTIIVATLSTAALAIEEQAARGPLLLKAVNLKLENHTPSSLLKYSFGSLNG